LAHARNLPSVLQGTYFRGGHSSGRCGVAVLRSGWITTG